MHQKCLLLVDLMAKDISVNTYSLVHAQITKNNSKDDEMGNKVNVLEDIILGDETTKSLIKFSS